MASAAALALGCGAAPAAAQTAGADRMEARSVDGRLFLGTRQSRRPLPGQWISLHRIDTRGGPARGRASGPIDSVRTSADGRFAFRYRAAADDSVLYVVMTMFGGIVYPTPLRSPVVRGEDGELVVFDTTSGPVPIAVRGRHLVVAAPREGDVRTLLEVYDLFNDSTVTIVSRRTGVDSAPVWSTRLPGSASAFELDPEGDVRATSTRRRGDRLELFAPLSPGGRRLAFSYGLTPAAFPLVIPMERRTELLEVLVQEPLAVVEGPGLTEVAAVEARGQVFRRFLAQDLPADAAIRVTMPPPGGVGIARAIPYIAGALGATLLACLALTLLRPVHRVVPARADRARLLHSLATLDAAFERNTAATDDQRASYERERQRLRTQVASLLGRE